MTSEVSAHRAVVLTPPGAAAIAVIRVCGESVVSFFRAHFSKPLTPLRCIHGELRDDAGQMIDDPVIVLHDDQRTADINLHGGPWVIAATLDLLRRNGFEVVENDPELLDADSVLEREMLAALQLARTEPALRMLLAQPGAWKEFLAASPSPAQIQRVLDDPCLWHLLHPPRVAIIGAPNVGKSTLANQLFAQQRSITADLPGTTRDYIGEIANIDGLPIILIDTPGLRDAADPIEREAIAKADAIIASADLRIVVADPSQPQAPSGSAGNVIRVMNKADLFAGARSETYFYTVATTGEGVDALRAAIRRFFGCTDMTEVRPRWWTQRQREALSEEMQNPHADQSAKRAMS